MMMTTTLRHTTLDLAGPTHVLDWGGVGPTTVLVHGLDGSAANWFDNGHVLAEHARVVAPDLPGFGRTPLAGRVPTMEASADLIADVIRTMDLGPSELMGNSMGGPVALFTAARHPELVSRVVLVAPALPRTANRIVEWGFASRFLLPFAIPSLMKLEPAGRHAKDPTRQVTDLLDLCFARGTAASSPALAEMIDVAAHRDRRDHVDGWYRAARSLFTWLSRPRAFHRLADQVEAPVHIVSGGLDPIIPASTIASALERHPSWTHVSMPRVGHVPQLEDPDGFHTACRGA